MRAYRLLLRMYPASFRTEYADEMCEMFALRRERTWGVWLWVSAFFEVLFNAAAVHWDIFRQDARYTRRTLLRTPGFTLTAILVVALGVGANTAVFSLTDHILLRPLPFPQPEQLVAVMETLPGYSRMELSPANFRDFKRASTTIEGMGTYDETSANLVGHGEPERVDGAAVTAGLLEVLRVQPLRGRLFNADDERPGAPQTLILGYSLWQSVFAGDEGIIGRSVTLDDTPYVVIGVMPRGFVFPTAEEEFWRIRRFNESSFQNRNNNYLTGVGRLRPGATLAAAQAELDVAAAQLKRQYPRENAETGVTVFALKDQVGARTQQLLYVLLGAAGCVLLIACTNLANLLLARALARQKELSVRTAMGAGRERLVRQLLTESAVLGLAGGALGAALAAIAIPLLARLVPNYLPIAATPAIDFRLFAVAGCFTAITGFAFGILPAYRICGRAGLEGLREGRAGSGRKGRLRSALAIAEVAISVVLLVGSGLLLRALWSVQSVDPGFRAEGVLTLRTALPFPRYALTAVREQFLNRVLTEARALPGVTDAAYISGLPMVMRGGIWPVDIDGKTVNRALAHTAGMRFVTPGFFAAMRIPIREGRDVSDSDSAGRLPVAVVSESLARRYWPGVSAIGRQFGFAFSQRTIVGVVGDVRVRGLERTSEPQVYLPSQQPPDRLSSFYAPKDLVIRSSRSSAALAPAVREIIRRADPAQPVTDVRTMEDIVAADTAPRAVQVRVIAIFAGVAFLLAAIGIHGVLSFAVSQRTSEIGVRIALGAQRSDILGMVLRHGAMLAVAGVLPGAALAYAAGRTMEAILAGVEPGDTAAFSAAVALAAVMTMAGSFVPALRAVRVDPIKAIRAD